MKNRFDGKCSLAFTAMAALALGLVSCKPETEYIERIVEKEVEVIKEVEKPVYIDSGKTSGEVKRVIHYKQSIDTKTYELQEIDTENKTLQEGTAFSGLEKTYEGFRLSGFSQIEDAVAVFYDRNTITYTFNSGTGKFSDGQTEKTLTGLYGAPVIFENNPEKADVFFEKWISESNAYLPPLFGAENMSFMASYRNQDIQDFVFVGGKSVTKPSSTSRQFKNCSETSPVNVDSFYIAKTELLYKKYKEVYDWATSSDRGDAVYSFAEGENGGKKSEGECLPVTNISCRDAVVWCNAASEMEGLQCVYVVSETDRTPVRKANTSIRFGIFLLSDADTAYVVKSATGYRLPTRTEWEFAALGGDPDAEDWNWKYAGTDNKEELADFAVIGTTIFNDDFVIGNVGQKKPNRLGLYDMSGNAGELTSISYNTASYEYVAVVCGLYTSTQHNSYDKNIGNAVRSYGASGSARVTSFRLARNAE